MVLGSTTGLVLFSNEIVPRKKRTCGSLKFREIKKPLDHIVFTPHLYATASLDNLHTQHFNNKSNFKIDKVGKNYASCDEINFEQPQRTSISLQNLKDIGKEETKKMKLNKSCSSSTRGSLKRVSRLFSVMIMEPSDNADENHPVPPRVRTPSIFRRLSRVVETTDLNKSGDSPNRNRRLSLKRNSEPNTNLSHSDIENGNDNNLRMPYSKSISSISTIRLRSPFLATPKFSQKTLTGEEKTKLFTDMLECIRKDDCKRLKILVKRKLIDINLVEKSVSLLHEACYKGCVRCVKNLIKNGSQVRLVDETGWTPLHAAIVGEHLEAVKILLQSDASLTAVTDEGWSPLHLAVSVGDLSIVHQIIIKGGDPLYCTSGKVTPFQLAINSKQTLILDYFLHLQRFLV